MFVLLLMTGVLKSTSSSSKYVYIARGQLQVSSGGEDIPKLGRV